MNKTPWLQLGLAAVLMVGCLVMAVGPAQARYRVNNKATVSFEARALEQIYLGQMVPTADDSGETYFDDTRKGSWQSVDGEICLEFAVANGKTTTKTDDTGSTITKQVFSQKDQRAYVRLIGDLSIWDGQREFKIKLIVPSQTESDEPLEYEAQITQIPKDSSLYKTFGPGWVFTFIDPLEEEELFWTLEGGKLSVVELKLVMEGEVPTSAGQLKLQVTGDYTK